MDTPTVQELIGEHQTMLQHLEGISNLEHFDEVLQAYPGLPTEMLPTRLQEIEQHRQHILELTAELVRGVVQNYDFPFDDGVV